MPPLPHSSSTQAFSSLAMASASLSITVGVAEQEKRGFIPPVCAQCVRHTGSSFCLRSLCFSTMRTSKVAYTVNVIALGIVVSVYGRGRSAYTAVTMEVQPNIRTQTTLNPNQHLCSHFKLRKFRARISHFFQVLMLLGASPLSFLKVI